MKYYIVKAAPCEINEKSTYGLFGNRSAMEVDGRYYYENATLYAVYDGNNTVESLRVLDRVHIIAPEDEYFFEAKNDREAIIRFNEIMKNGFNAYEKKVFRKVEVICKENIDGRNFYGRCGIDVYNPKNGLNTKILYVESYTQKVGDDYRQGTCTHECYLKLDDTKRKYIGTMSEIIFS